MQPATSAATPSDARTYPFQVRGSLQTILSLRLLVPGDPEFFTLLLDKIAHSPDFFRDAPIVLDVAAIADTPPIDLETFVERLRAQRLVPIGLANGSPAWLQAAASAGLARFGGGAPMPDQPTAVLVAPQPHPDPAQPSTPPPAVVAPAPRPRASRIVEEPVRGGQQIYEPDGDLVVLGAVGNGAEVAAAGHVHIYGPLRGRAFAGVDGDERAMIFCDQLAAELLSVAGVYLVNEAIDPRLMNRRVRVACSGERLVLHPVP